MKIFIFMVVCSCLIGCQKEKSYSYPEDEPEKVDNYMEQINEKIEEKVELEEVKDRIEPTKDNNYIHQEIEEVFTEILEQTKE